VGSSQVVVRPGGSSGGGTRQADGENADGGDASSPPEGKVARSIGSLETFRDSSFLRCPTQCLFRATPFSRFSFATKVRSTKTCTSVHRHALGSIPKRIVEECARVCVGAVTAAIR